MARIRIVEISNFRAIKELKWFPAQGINCLIGPGDSGKSSILEAIDLCLGARRSVTFNDADFFRLNTAEPIIVALTLGSLEDSIKNMETYGNFLRGFDSTTGTVEDEPDSSRLETVVRLVMTVSADLDPQWTLESDRASAMGMTRNLTLSDRQEMAPNRVGTYGNNLFAWRRGSVVDRLDKPPDISAALATVARDARASLGEEADRKLRKTLDIVDSSATTVGIDLGTGSKALLDIQALSFSGGSIAVHDAHGVPLSGLGIGSTRLLVTALQRQMTSKTGIILLDELEYGLEPHRIIRLIDLLGAKEEEPKQQSFVTTHSPVALREFSGDQLFVVRKTSSSHVVMKVGVTDDMQATIRSYPEGFLAPSVLVCEGASEVGFIRGLNRHFTNSGNPSVETCGVALVDGKGGNPVSLIDKTKVFLALGYRAACFMDSDVPIDSEAESSLYDAKGSIVRWPNGLALEDALFQGLPDGAVEALLNRAIELRTESVVDQHIRAKSNQVVRLLDVRAEKAVGAYSVETRTLLGQASKMKQNGWFKTLSCMEGVAYDIVVPCHGMWSDDFNDTIKSLWNWIDNARSD